MIYEFLNENTGEIVEISMKLADYEDYKLNNPHMKRYFSTMNRVIDPIALGRIKPPIEFKENVIDRIKRNNPLHNMESRWN